VFDLSSKSVVVTGGGRGLGRGIAVMMARAGASLVICGRTPETLDASAAEVRGIGASAVAVPADVTRAEDLERVRDRALAEFGYIDCWVNNAGSANPGDVGPLINITEEQWDAVVDLNLKAMFFACQLAARTMTRGGSIINMSSRSGSQPNPRTGHYGAAKAGVENLTATMAVEWGHLGIRVNAVAPGVVPTEISLESGSMSRPSRRQRQIETIPLRRLGTVEDVGALCVYLASDEASWMTGEVIQLTGGSRIPVGYLTYMHHITQQLAGAEDASAMRPADAWLEDPR
jgi:NAD(P)-dependent dehydrogenase (short-subunit alcohol dehydrogenase family)